MTNKLDIGARREIFVFDGRGGGEWQLATLIGWTDVHNLRVEIGHMIFVLNEPGPNGEREILIPCSPTSIGPRVRMPVEK